MSIHRCRILIYSGLVFLTGLVIAINSSAQVGSRKLAVSQQVPEFSVLDETGAEFTYDKSNKDALLIIFFSPKKSQSIKAISDIEELIKSLPEMPHKLSFLAVSDDPNAENAIKIEKNEQLSPHFIKDTDFELWGKFGVIAYPTVFISDPNGKIVLIKAGYGYDFAPAVKSGLWQIMGLSSAEDVNDAGVVKTVTNTSKEEKADRHLKMAKMLKERGKYEAALKQLQSAIEIDPNSIEGVLELGKLYCIVDDPNKAIDIVNGIKVEDKKQKAAQMFVLGNAYRQLEQYEQAEKYLLEAVELDPQNSQAFYILGRVYHLQNLKDKALEAYFTALRLIYNDKK
jgi:tetratricopeptide (TPR) repeat protein